jgi:hypothetical protein
MTFFLQEVKSLGISIGIAVWAQSHGLPHGAAHSIPGLEAQVQQQSRASSSLQPGVPTSAATACCSCVQI